MLSLLSKNLIKRFSSNITSTAYLFDEYGRPDDVLMYYNKII